MWTNPASIDVNRRPRAVTFENLTGAAGAGGSAAGGRKGSPDRILLPGQAIDLVDLDGPGCINHLWMTFLPGRPERMRAQLIEVFYDGADEPSIAVPALDFFGLPHGRPVAYHSAVTAVQEGRGFNSTVPLPFREHIRIRYTNGSDTLTPLYFQADLTLAPQPDDVGLLHVLWRRQNPTVMREDHVVVDGLRGPGRFLGCVVGVRPIDGGNWYGEGEVKIYLDGDRDLPTICGTGLEDYVGSAWGMGAHAAPYSGAPLIVQDGDPEEAMSEIPDFVGFYRWHLVDPIDFAEELKVTIQQIGQAQFRDGEDEAFARYQETNPSAGNGWMDFFPGFLAMGIAERVDDYCSAAFVYCAEAQPVPRVDLGLATADIGRRPYEQPSALERAMREMSGS
jgi:hypothetical protein